MAFFRAKELQTERFSVKYLWEVGAKVNSGSGEYCRIVKSATDPNPLVGPLGRAEALGLTLTSMAADP